MTTNESDPVLKMRGSEGATELTKLDLLQPDGVPERNLTLHAGVVHPAVFAELAAILGITASELRGVLDWELYLDENARVLTAEPGENLECRGISAILQALGHKGIDSRDWVLDVLRVPPGNERSNERPFGDGHPVLSPQNAAWLSLLGRASVIRALADESTFLMHWYGRSLQREFEHLVATLTGDDPQFVSAGEFPTEPPRPQIELIEPPKFAQGHSEGELTEPIDACFVANGFLLRFPNALVHVEDSGTFSITPLGRGNFRAVSEDGQRVLVVHSAGNVRAAVYDVRTRRFSNSLTGMLPRAVGATCGDIEIHDLVANTSASVPGPGLSSGIGSETSPCGGFCWLSLNPHDDEVGIFDTQTGRRVFQPWPHPALEDLCPTTAHEFGDGETYDERPRALVRHGRSFRLFYAGALFDGTTLRTHFPGVSLARFDRTGNRLLVACGGELCIVRLDEKGAPRDERRIALSVFDSHVTPRGLRLPKSVPAQDLMMVVGTMEELAATNDVKVLQERFASFFLRVPPARTLNAIVRDARKVVLSYVLNE